jgi:prefoldin alpha subunit
MQASQKFTDSKLVLNYLKERTHGKEIMVPLTSSLYVPGIMEENERVLVEVGAGYFVEESTDKAREYCDRKIKYLNESGQKVAEIVNVKKLQHQKVQTEY